MTSSSNELLQSMSSFVSLPLNFLNVGLPFLDVAGVATFLAHESLLELVLESSPLLIHDAFELGHFPSLGI